jgi:hypothetical protein
VCFVGNTWSPSSLRTALGLVAYQYTGMNYAFTDEGLSFAEPVFTFVKRRESPFFQVIPSFQ